MPGGAYAKRTGRKVGGRRTLTITGTGGNVIAQKSGPTKKKRAPRRVKSTRTKYNRTYTGMKGVYDLFKAPNSGARYYINGSGKKVYVKKGHWRITRRGVRSHVA